LGRFHQHTSAAFSRAHDEKRWVNGEQRLANLALILLVKLKGKFFAKLCAPTTFCWAKKVW